MKLFLPFLLAIFWFQIGSAQLNQKSQRIRYFSGHTNPTAWDNGKSAVYKGGAATVTTVGTSLPVESIDGNKALKFESTLSSGYWNVIFKISVHEVNFMRMGNSPYLYLKVKWTSISPNADVDIEIQTYADDKYLLGNNTNQTASVKLSNYVTPSTSSWQEVYIPLSDFTAKNPNLNLTRVPFIRFLGSGNYSTVNTMYLEALDIVPSNVDQYTDAVKVNQIGYLPNQKKVGIVSFEPRAASVTPASFKVVTVPGETEVFSGALVRKTAFSATWGQDNDEVYHADFSAFKTPGTYKLVVESLNQASQSFEISTDVYDQKFRDALRFFYYARSGEAIVEPFAEGHTRQAFYENEVAAPYAYQSGTRDIRGGWFDAGDLHKDIHAQTEAIWYLLETLESFKTKNGSDHLNIPESDASVNDLYLLIKYGLDWMSKMWNDDGSVQFWIEYGGFPGTIGEISNVSSGSASTLAGLFAKAYPLFKAESQFSLYADSLRIKAEKSWEWLSNNVSNIDPINPRTGSSYSYGMDANEDLAMRSFAAIELYVTTGKSTYQDYFIANYGNPLTDFGGNQAWGGIIQHLDHSYINLAYIDYIHSNQLGINTTIQNELKAEFVKLADWSIERINYTPYNIPLAASNHLYWGSSGAIATYGYLYNMVYEWTLDSKYKDAIYNCVDWIMGRNPVNRIFVTGYGDALHGTDVYSFYWMDINNPPPGYMCGNINAADTQLKPYFKDPWKQYINMQQASILEPGIYWNAEYAWLMGYMASEKIITGTEEKTVANNGEFILYPNPAHSTIHIASNEEIYSVQVFGIDGKLLISDHQSTVNLSSLSPGAYFVTINNNNRATKKLVVY